MPWEGIVGLLCGIPFFGLIAWSLCSAAALGDEQADHAAAETRRQRAAERAAADACRPASCAVTPLGPTRRRGC